jgi:DNA polymerase V
VSDNDLESYGKQIRAQVARQLGLPVSIGIATTKVLTKVAAETVKRHPTSYRAGVLTLETCSRQEREEVLAALPVEEVWGIGKATALRLAQRGIFTALGLREADHIRLRHALGVLTQRAALELQGVCCLPLVEKPRRKHRISVARSFARPVTRRVEIEEAIATYTVRAAELLRQQRAVTGHLSLFLQTNPFDKRVEQYAAGASTPIAIATASTPLLLEVALLLARSIHREGYQYKRAGVTFSHLRPEDVIQPDLFGFFSPSEQARESRLMAVVDAVNWQWGAGHAPLRGTRLRTHLANTLPPPQPSLDHSLG